MNKYMMVRHIAVILPLLSLISCRVELQDDDVIGTWYLSAQSAAVLEIDLAESPASLEFIRGGVVKAKNMPSYPIDESKRNVYTGAGTWSLVYFDYSTKVQVVLPIVGGTWKGHFYGKKNNGSVVLTYPIGDPDNAVSIEFKRHSR